MTARWSGSSGRRDCGAVILVPTRSGGEALATGLVGTLAVDLGGAGARGLDTILAEALALGARPVAGVAVRAGTDGVASGRPVTGDSRVASVGGVSARTGEEASGSPEGWTIAGFAATDSASERILLTRVFTGADKATAPTSPARIDVASRAAPLRLKLRTRSSGSSSSSPRGRPARSAPLGKAKNVASSAPSSRWPG